MSRARRWRGLVPAGALLAGLLLCPAPPAGAHASLVRSAPAHRAVLGQMPERVQLWFNERLEPAYSTVSVWSNQSSSTSNCSGKGNRQTVVLNLQTGGTQWLCDGDATGLLPVRTVTPAEKYWL